MIIAISYIKLFPFISDTKIKMKYLKCVWCQRVIHDSIACKNSVLGIGDYCDLGLLARHIINPSWLIKKVCQETDQIGTKQSNVKKHSIFSIKLPEHLPENFEPIVVFINLKSGSQDGEELYHLFLKYFNSRQIFLLPENDPEDV